MRCETTTAGRLIEVNLGYNPAMQRAEMLSYLESLDRRGYFWKTGVLGVTWIALGMLVSAIFYRGRLGEPFNPLNHFVSELGEVGVAPLAAAFNAGLILGGLCMAFAVIGLALQVGGRWGLSLGGVGIWCGLSGMLVGIFPMNNLLPHIFWSMSFFNTGLLVVVIFSLAAFFGQRRLPRWLVLPALLPIAALISFTFLPQSLQHTGNPLASATAAVITSRPALLSMAVFEWLAILSIMLWALILALVLRPRRGKTAPHTGSVT